MSLYLCVFDGDREIEGVEVGSYADFNAFREFAALFGGAEDPLAAFPTLLEHSDCDGTWSPEECETLRRELAAVAEASGSAPDASIFTDVDGELLIDRLRHLADIAVARRLPILFQ
jgi:hypothetical protein